MVAVICVSEVFDLSLLIPACSSSSLAFCMWDSCLSVPHSASRLFSASSLAARTTSHLVLWLSLSSRALCPPVDSACPFLPHRQLPVPGSQRARLHISVCVPASVGPSTFVCSLQKEVFSVCCALNWVPILRSPPCSVVFAVPRPAENR